MDSSSSNKKWTLREQDQLMDLALDGKTPEEIGKMMRRTEEFIKAKFKDAFYPKEPYHPWGRRKSRAGMKLTELEKGIISKHHKFGIPVAHTALMLQRKPDEVCPDYFGAIKFDQMRAVAVSSDQLLAHHYLHRHSKAIISDQAYDKAKEEEIAFGNSGALLKALAKCPKNVTDYPPHIRSLAYYMLWKSMEATGEWDNDRLPYSWTADQ